MIFFRNSPNGSIRKVNWLKSKFEHLLQNLPTTGGHRPSLRNFSTKNENKLLGHFIDLGLFDMSDMAYSDRQSRCLITNSNQGAEKAH